MNEKIIEHLREQAFEMQIPFQGQFELTHACNLKCKMCYLNGAVRAESFSVRPASFWLQIAREARDQGLMVLSITGGEPFLYPDLEELMEGLCSMGFLISFNTNGTLLSGKSDFFRRYPVSKINISLYGASNETYRKLCGSLEDGFDRVSRVIDELLDAGQNVYLTAVITPENREDIPAMKAFAEERGLELHMTGYLYPAVGVEDHRCDPVQTADIFYTLDYLHNREHCISSCVKIKAIESGQFKAEGIPVCTGGKNSFAVTCEGKLVPCVMMRSLYENLDQKPFAQCWQDICRKMKQQKVPEKCTTCKFAGNICPSCKASLLLEKANGTEDYPCTMSEKLYTLIGRKPE